MKSIKEIQAAQNGDETSFKALCAQLGKACADGQELLERDLKQAAKAAWVIMQGRTLDKGVTVGKYLEGWFGREVGKDVINVYPSLDSGLEEKEYDRLTMPVKTLAALARVTMKVKDAKNCLGTVTVALAEMVKLATSGTTEDLKKIGEIERSIRKDSGKWTVMNSAEIEIDKTRIARVEFDKTLTSLSETAPEEVLNILVGNLGKVKYVTREQALTLKCASDGLLAHVNRLLALNQTSPNAKETAPEKVPATA